MSKTKVIFTLVLILGLAALSIYMNKDAFDKTPIQISHRMSPWMRQAKPTARRKASDLGVPLTFTMNNPHKLIAVKVVLVADMETNQFPHAIWHLSSTSNSVPTTSFNYGSYIRGMKPEVKGARPDPLEPGVAYRLIVTTDSNEQVQHDFMVSTNR
jgi:hypothetical protein